MAWNKRDLARLASSHCPACSGSGLTGVAETDYSPCNCALSGIFRACYARFRDCIQDRSALSRVNFERTSAGQSNRGSWGLKRQEFIVDFELAARRTLSPPLFRLFRYHYLLGADAELCAPRLGVSIARTRSYLAHIESTLGRTLYTTRPYALYPLWDYFNRHSAEPVKPCVSTGRICSEPWRRTPLPGQAA